MAKTEHPLRKITWLDPCSPDATAVHNVDDLSAVHRPMRVVTMGWVLQDDAVGITMACEHCGGGEYRGLTFILRDLIVEDEVLERPRRRRRKAATASGPEAAENRLTTHYSPA